MIDWSYDGVDINVYVESYDKQSGKWEEEYWWDAKHNKKVPVYDGRDYGLFGILAGVRSNSDSLVEPRGIPDDLSDSVKKEWDNGDCFFGATWYDYCELDAYVYSLSNSSKIIKLLLGEDDEDYMKVNFCGVDLADDIRYNLEQIESLEDFMWCINYVICGYDDKIMPGDVRIVMWFDC